MQFIPNVTGPFQVVLSATELAAILGKCRNTINNWDRTGFISGLRDKPRTGRRGRCHLQYDLWEVLQALKRGNGS